jgi:hypothetical protein
MNAPSVVGHERLFRVLSGKLKGQLVPESETVECDSAFDGCDGAGVLSVRFEWRGWPQDGERDCHVCGGVGRVLGYPEHGDPHRLELVGDGPCSTDNPPAPAGHVPPQPFRT